jgi:uncharacterized protein (UPF0332 family)
MSLSELKKRRAIREIPVDKKQIENLIELAERDLKVAQELLAKNFDWSYSIFYNSMLQISRALMFSYGYTTTEEEHHRATVEFARAIMGEKEGELIEMLDRMRRKRHGVTYDEAGTVSEFEAKKAFETAKRYFDIVKKKIAEKVR